MRCEACRKPGKYREDYAAVLCDTHAEIPSYGRASEARVSALDWIMAIFVWLPVLGLCAAWESIEGRLFPKRRKFA